MVTKQIRITDDCIKILDTWRHEGESHTDAIRRIGRCLKKHKEIGVLAK